MFNNTGGDHARLALNPKPYNAGDSVVADVGNTLQP